MTRILMVATSADRMTPGTEPTGVWLEELTTPYYAFRDAGAEVTLASIKGGAIPVDQRSVNADGENDASVERYLKDEALKAEVASTPVFTSIDPAGYDALFLPGGHGTMFDYPVSDELARLVERFDREGKIVAAVRKSHAHRGYSAASLVAISGVVWGTSVVRSARSRSRDKQRSTSAAAIKACPLTVGWQWSTNSSHTPPPAIRRNSASSGPWNNSSTLTSMPPASAVARLIVSITSELDRVPRRSRRLASTSAALPASTRPRPSRLRPCQPPSKLQRGWLSSVGELWHRFS